MLTPEQEENFLIEQLSGVFTAIPFNSMLGLSLDHITANYVSLSIKMKKELVGNFLLGILHGGVTSSVLDMAGGMVVMSAAIHKNTHRTPEELQNIVGKTSTIDLNINYISPGKGELFIAKAWLVKHGRRISFARMELMNQNDDLIATGHGTYLLQV